MNGLLVTKHTETHRTKQSKVSKHYNNEDLQESCLLDIHRPMSQRRKLSPLVCSDRCLKCIFF